MYNMLFMQSTFKNQYNMSCSNLSQVNELICDNIFSSNDNVSIYRYTVLVCCLICVCHHHNLYFPTR